MAPTADLTLAPASVVTPDQLALIKTTIAKDATDTELQLFFYDCRRQGVHPLDKLIYFTKRSGKYTPLTSIDFMRQRAASSGEGAGIDDAVFAGTPKTRDFAATVTVYRLVQGMKCAYTATARWSEYKPDQDFMWQKMPHTMLGKCAEALALRKAFPQQLAGLYAKEELDQAEIVDAEPKGWVPTPITPAQQRKLFSVAISNGWDKPAMREKLRALNIEHTAAITGDRFDEVLRVFEQPPAPVVPADSDDPF